MSPLVRFCSTSAVVGFAFLFALAGCDAQADPAEAGPPPLAQDTVVVSATTVLGNDPAASLPQSACNAVMAPVGTVLTKMRSGDHTWFEVNVPEGYMLAQDDAGIRFVEVPGVSFRDPVTYDCDCDEGLGGCTEAVNPNNGHIYCDRYDGCRDCKMTVG